MFSLQCVLCSLCSVLLASLTHSVLWLLTQCAQFAQYLLNLSNALKYTFRIFEEQKETTFIYSCF